MMRIFLEYVMVYFAGKACEEHNTYEGAAFEEWVSIIHRNFLGCPASKRDEPYEKIYVDNTTAKQNYNYL
jgi:hypothetical protein